MDGSWRSLSSVAGMAVRQESPDPLRDTHGPADTEMAREVSCTCMCEQNRRCLCVSACALRGSTVPRSTCCSLGNRTQMAWRAPNSDMRSARCSLASGRQTAFRLCACACASRGLPTARSACHSSRRRTAWASWLRGRTHFDISGHRAHFDVMGARSELHRTAKPATPTYPERDPYKLSRALAISFVAVPPRIPVPQGVRGSLARTHTVLNYYPIADAVQNNAPISRPPSPRATIGPKEGAPAPTSKSR